MLSPNSRGRVVGVLDGEEYMRYIPSLEESNLLWIVDGLDKVRRCVIALLFAQPGIDSRWSRSFQFRVSEVSV